MKVLVVLACFLVAVYGLPPEIVEQIKAKVKAAGVECKGEVGASDDDVAQLKAHQPPATHTAKCFVACIHKKFGFQDKAGKIDKEGTYAMIEKMKPFDEELYGKMKQVTDNCIASVTDSDDECETAAAIYDCFVKKSKLLELNPSTSTEKKMQYSRLPMRRILLVSDLLNRLG